MQSEGSNYKVTIFKNSEKPTGLHPLLSGIGNERVNNLVCVSVSVFDDRLVMYLFDSDIFCVALFIDLVNVLFLLFL